MLVPLLPFPASTEAGVPGSCDSTMNAPVTLILTEPGCVMVLPISVVVVIVRGRPEFGDVESDVAVAVALCPSSFTLLPWLSVRTPPIARVMASSLGLPSRGIAGSMGLGSGVGGSGNFLVFLCRVSLCRSLPLLQLSRIEMLCASE